MGNSGQVFTILKCFDYSEAKNITKCLRKFAFDILSAKLV